MTPSPGPATDIKSTIARVRELYIGDDNGDVCSTVVPERPGSADWADRDITLACFYRTAAPLLARECERLRAALDLATIEERMLDEAEADDREPTPEDIAAAEIAEEEFQAWKRERDSRNPSAVAALITDRDTARAVLTRIAATMSCEPDDDADLVEAVRLLVVERDKGKAARAEVERLRAGITTLRAAWLAQPDSIREYQGLRKDARQLLEAVVALLAEVPQ